VSDVTIESPLAVYDRCRQLPLSSLERQQTYADLTVAAHAAATATSDPEQRNRFVHEALYVATAALELDGPQHLPAVCTALAHRAVLLAEIGHHESASADARRARALAAELGMDTKDLVPVALVSGD
jgi:hypothetical protein